MIQAETVAKSIFSKFMAKGKHNFVFFTSFIMKYKHTLDFVGDSLRYTPLVGNRVLFDNLCLSLMTVRHFGHQNKHVLGYHKIL